MCCATLSALSHSNIRLMALNQSSRKFRIVALDAPAAIVCVVQRQREGVSNLTYNLPNLATASRTVWIPSNITRTSLE